MSDVKLFQNKSIRDRFCPTGTTPHLADPASAKRVFDEMYCQPKRQFDADQPLSGMVADLAMLVRRLVRQVGHNASVVQDAERYLKKHGLDGSPLDR